MGKAQSKRSVDITTETKKGTEDEITEKMEKIEDLDKKEVLNGDATISEKRDQEIKDTEVVENDKDLTTEKDVNEQGSGDAVEPQNAADTSKDEGGSTTAEEISPLADESVKKSKKEKVKKKWSFRSISFGKKDKQKPAKSEEAAEDGSSATNGADSDEKTLTEPEDTQKEKSAIECEEKTMENHENGNATPQELNAGEQNEEKTSEEKNNITVNTTNITTTTETCESVQKETATVSSDLSEKTENTAVNNESKISEKATFEDSSKYGNGIDEKINSINQEPQKIDNVSNAMVEAPSEKKSTLDSAVTITSLASTNGELIEQIHQNGDHGEAEQEVVEKSKAQIEVNNTDNKVSAASLDIISITSINPSNVQIHIQDVNASNEKSYAINETNDDESIVQISTDLGIDSRTVDQSSLSEVRIVDVENIQIETASNLASETIDTEKPFDEKFGVEQSPPPLPISPPPSQVSVFAFTASNESVKDSIENKNFEAEVNLNEEEKKEIPLPLSEPRKREILNSQETDRLSMEKIDEKTSSYDQVFEVRYHEYKELEEKENILKDSNKENKVFSSEINAPEISSEIVNQQLIYNEMQSSQYNTERREDENDVMKENIVVEHYDNKEQRYFDNQEFESEIVKNSKESVIVPKQTNNTECSLHFSISQDQDEMFSQKNNENLEEKNLDPSKEIGNAKDIKDNVTVAEITQDLSVTCE